MSFQVQVAVRRFFPHAASHRYPTGTQHQLFHHCQFLHRQVVEVVQIKVSVARLGTGNFTAKQIQLVGRIHKSVLGVIHVRFVNHRNVVRFAPDPLGQIFFEQIVGGNSAILHCAYGVVHVGNKTGRVHPFCVAGKLRLYVLNNSRQRHYARLLGKVVEFGQNFIGKAAKSTHPNVETASDGFQQGTFRFHGRSVRHNHRADYVQIGLVDAFQHLCDVGGGVFHRVAFVDCNHFAP